ncbi:MAG: type II secretion system protein GspG [Deltaproteobacteria bacterium RBG_16_48_10]|nr:MAG: type II secretion system protein GspG [Deltaproteobacteria bacterium RBG_16_48_10]
MEDNEKVKQRAKGFTFFEILVVVTIIGLLAALVGPRLWKRISGGKQVAAKAQIELFGTALDAFRLDTGRYPTTEEGLKALREKPSSADNWSGPYLPKEIPMDPWKTQYVYKCPGEHGDYDIISYGADKVEGGEGESEDVVSWKDIGK